VEPRTCPTCGSAATSFVQRGLAGATDERDQYFACRDCGRVTYEIVSRTARDLRMGRYEAGRPIKLAGDEYVVSRVLKVGLNESLVYVKPADNERDATRPRPVRR
jgi:RNA polymerase subunit RPABC4/transcription elongation factor Spt4